MATVDGVTASPRGTPKALQRLGLGRYAGAGLLPQRRAGAGLPRTATHGPGYLWQRRRGARRDGRGPAYPTSAAIACSARSVIVTRSAVSMHSSAAWKPSW